MKSTGAILTSDYPVPELNYQSLAKNQHLVSGNRLFQALIGCNPSPGGLETTEYSSDRAQTKKPTPARGNPCRVLGRSGPSEASSASVGHFSGCCYQSFTKNRHRDFMKLSFLPPKGSLTASLSPEIAAFGSDTAESLKIGMQEPTYDGGFRSIPEARDQQGSGCIWLINRIRNTKFREMIHP